MRWLDYGSQDTYARNIGELRAAIADLPDDFPLVSTAMKQNGFKIERFNAHGIQIRTGSWLFSGQRSEKWGLRLVGFSPDEWESIMNSTWRDVTAKDLKA